jgi:hypothetical protein
MECFSLQDKRFSSACFLKKQELVFIEVLECLFLWRLVMKESALAPFHRQVRGGQQRAKRPGQDRVLLQFVQGFIQRSGRRRMPRCARSSSL